MLRIILNSIKSDKNLLTVYRVISSNNKHTGNILRLFNGRGLKTKTAQKSTHRTTRRGLFHNEIPPLGIYGSMLIFLAFTAVRRNLALSFFQLFDLLFHGRHVAFSGADRLENHLRGRGTLLMRTPMARDTAFRIAGVTGTVATSEMPFAPNGPCGSGSRLK